MTAAPTLRLAVVALLVGLVASVAVPATGAEDDEFAVLVYTRTAGFRHLSIPDGVRTVTELGAEHGFEVEHTEDPAAFTPDNLGRFEAVVFLNTTGDIMTAEGRDVFEAWVRGGGAWVGVHSASDTEYGWPFYGELLAGAWFHSHPIQQPGVIVNEAPDEPSTAHLPGRWLIPLEEFYSFVANPRERTRVLLSIDEDTYLQDPNTTNLPPPEFAIPDPDFLDGESGVMGDHPMAWCHDIDAGRAWYTALGHESHLYLLPDFRQHLLGGLLSATRRVEADCEVAAADPATSAPAPDAAPDPDETTAGPLPDSGATATLVALLVLLGGVVVRRTRTA